MDNVYLFPNYLKLGFSPRVYNLVEEKRRKNIKITETVLDIASLGVVFCLFSFVFIGQNNAPLKIS